MYIMGLLLVCNASFMLLASIISFAMGDDVATDILTAALMNLSLGGLGMYAFRNHKKELRKREGFFIVGAGWLLLVFSGVLPYVFSGSIKGFENAFFETMSGYTTTGATVIDQIEILPKGILLWRSLTHWIGGMGIIVLAIAIIPLLGIGGMQLFAAEAPGPGGDKLHPRITDTAKRLWYIYVGYTLVETILLWGAGMSLFDALNHSLSTMSTGGFSTKNSSIAFWNDQPLIQYIIIVFMFLAGTNFVLSYYALTGKVQKVLQDDEFRFYFKLIIAFAIITALGIRYYSDFSAVQTGWDSIETAFRHGLFQVVAVITTTGFVTSDFTAWNSFLTVLFFGLMFAGGSSGSTSGGVKIVRHLLIIKNSLLEFKRSLHQNAIIPVRFNSRAVDKQIVDNVIGFFVLYMLLCIAGSAILALCGLDFETAIGGAASALGNVGPALGEINPVSTYAALPVAAKICLSVLMLLGRLELFTILILVSPSFWRNF